MPQHKPPITGSFITSTRTRRGLPVANETMKLERETQEKMRKFAELQSNIVVERQVTEELRKEVLAKGWWNLSSVPSGHDNANKPAWEPTKSLFSKQRSPGNFKIKRSSTFRSPPDTNLKENKVAKCDPSIGRAQTLKGDSASPDFDKEKVHCKSAVEALKEWHNSGYITPPDLQQTNRALKPQQQSQAQHMPSPCQWDEGTGQPMNVNINVDMEVQPNRTWCTMDTQTETIKQAEIELDHQSTLQGTYFQHLCNQGRNVRV